ncbi:MAG: 50S ribosomal protein L11 methyltransferase [Candidatus Wallbacteria bacterium]|nr:50S ribosomal protein L11 methyltransferase [Candidatus Wallbacteria bacterium]
MIPPLKFLKFTIELPEKSEELAIAALWECGLENSMVEYCQGKVKVSVFLPAGYEPADLSSSISAQLPGVSFSLRTDFIEDSWSAKLHGDFQALEIGEFLILPEHLEPSTSKLKLIRIRPAQAFGTGHHETTALVLELISEFDFREKKVLDVGCGTGILGIASLLKGASRVVCLDIDPLAVANTEENLELNGLSGKIEASSRLFSEFAGVQFDFIFANIITEELIRLKEHFRQAVTRGTTVFFSGITVDQVPRFRGEFPFFNLKEFKRGDWAALIATKI